MTPDQLKALNRCPLCGKILTPCNGTSNFWCEWDEMHFFYEELDKSYEKGS